MFAKRPAKFAADLGVERAERLVEQQDLRLAGKRSSERDALPLAARQFAREARSEAGQLDEFEQLRRRARRISGFGRPRRPRHHRRGRRRYSARRSCGRTKHNAERRSRSRARRRTCPSRRACRTRPGPPPASSSPAIIAQQGRLARARRPEQRDELAVFDLRARRRPAPDRPRSSSRLVRRGSTCQNRAAISSRCRHSRRLLRARVTRARSARSEATAKAATKLYSL